MEKTKQNKNYCLENAFETVQCKILNILSRVHMTNWPIVQAITVNLLKGKLN